MARAEPARWSRAAYERRVLDSYPMVAYARLHRFGPGALVFIAWFAFAGSTLSAERTYTDAGELISASADRRTYADLNTRTDQLRQSGGEPSLEALELAAIDRWMESLAHAARLQDCLHLYRPNVECRGHEPFGADSLRTQFWRGWVAGALMLLFWLYLQLRESWMLPRWSPRLWYTPVYATLIGLVMCGPPLMAFVLLERATTGYHLEPLLPGIPQPSLLLFVVLVLQLAAVAVGLVKSNVTARAFGIDGAIAAALSLVWLSGGA